MPKYLIHANYHADGARGLIKEKASGRRAAVEAAVKSLGGSLECFYYCFGADDAVLIVDLPSNVEMAAVSLATAATGAVHIRTTPLMTIEEVDKATGLVPKSAYRGPGQ